MKRAENSNERSKKGCIGKLIDAVKMAVELYKENKDRTVSDAVKAQKKTGTGILVVGTSGCGKSSTINALLGSNVAVVNDEFSGEGGRNEGYSKGDLTLYEITNTGNEEEIMSYKKSVTDKITALDHDGNRIADLVLLIVDGSGRELGVVCDLISNAILPVIGSKQKIVVAINQADMVMKGRNWDYEKSEPNQTLKAVLDEKAESVKRRILESTGLQVDIICYSAGCTDEDGNRSMPYNLQTLKELMAGALDEQQKQVFQKETNGSCRAAD